MANDSIGWPLKTKKDKTPNTDTAKQILSIKTTSLVPYFVKLNNNIKPLMKHPTIVGMAAGPAPPIT